MPCVKRKFLAFAIFAIIALAPSVSFGASQSCECFCGEAGKGAMDMDSSTKEACKQTCDDTNTKYIGCFTDSTQYPVESDKCWTQDECSSWSDERNGVTVKATWGTVFPPDCSKTKTSQEEMHYCYAKDVPYDLNITFGNVTKVENLPEYINVVYTWLLPAASLVAVVMMMIGGLQYTLARGKSKYIEKAKTRITNAITGIVILMSAFVILNLIDPRLVSFDALKIPLLKEVTILDPSSSCERLSDYGYEIKPVQEVTESGYKRCGGQGTIEDISGVEGNVTGSWKEGETCNYRYCSDGETCVSDDGSYSCKSCSEVPAETASASTCAAIEEFNAGQSAGTQIYCQYDATLRSCTTAGTGLGTVQGFYCGTLQADARVSIKDNGHGCTVYNDLDFGYSSSVIDLTSEKGKTLLQKICEEDRCKIDDVWAKEGYPEVSCYYDTRYGCLAKYTGE